MEDLESRSLIQKLILNILGNEPPISILPISLFMLVTGGIVLVYGAYRYVTDNASNMLDKSEPESVLRADS